MSLRRRLALWYGGLLAVVLIVALSLAYALHADSHDSDVDTALNDMASHASADIEMQLTSGVPLASVTLEALHRAIDEPLAVWLVQDGTVLAAIGATDNVLLATLDAAAAGEGWATRWSADGRMRTLAIPVAAPATFLVLAADLRAIDSTNAQLRWAFFFLGLTSVGIGMAAASAVTGTALRPVAAIAATADDIASSRDFTRRMRVTGDPEDELVALGSTIDTMLASLEDSYDAQRRFLSDVSHELRTPLTVIHGNAQLLAAGEMDAEGQRDAAAHTLRESERLTRLVEKLLVLARAGAAEPFAGAPVQLDEVVMDTFEELRIVAGPRLRVRSIDAVTVIGERDRLKQLLVVLLDNALRYTPPPRTVSISLASEDGEAVVRVEDEGIGLPAVPSARLFDRAYRGPEARVVDPSGSGLGLAIARSIVTRHGGSITLEPNEPRGARAIVRLPVRPATS